MQNSCRFHLLLPEAAAALATHIFPGCARVGVLTCNKGTAQPAMALKMGPQGFHLADTLHPWPAPPPPPTPGQLHSHRHPLQSPDHTDMVAQSRISAHPFPRREGQGRGCGADSPPESNTGHRAPHRASTPTPGSAPA